MMQNEDEKEEAVDENNEEVRSGEGKRSQR
jgi:hypothetical protein